VILVVISSLDGDDGDGDGDDGDGDGDGDGGVMVFTADS
jgi:hypothetical protein